MSDVGAVVLGYIFPANREGLEYALERLEDSHFSDDAIQQNLFRIARAYGERYGDVFPAKFLADHLRRMGSDQQRILYAEIYASLANSQVAEHEFRYAVDALIDEQQKLTTGAAIATSFEILETGREVDGQMLKGHTAAREYLSSQLAVIEERAIVEDTPEGDLRTEGDRLLALYEERENSEEVPGITFGITALDNSTGGVQPGELCLLAAYTNEGKASGYSTPILTPSGWTTMGSLRVGDLVVGSDGRSNRVLQIHEQGIQERYRLFFSDQTSTDAVGSHLWKVQDQNQRAGKVSEQWRILSTQDLIERMQTSPAQRWYLPLLSQPVQFETRSLPIDPYVLGVLLGDGHLSRTPLVTNPAEQIRKEVESRLPSDEVHLLEDQHDCPRWSITGGDTYRSLLQLKLAGYRSWEKFIPAIYMIADPVQRLDLLRGLMDTNGYAGQASINFDTTSYTLALQVRELVQSFGGTARLHGEKWGAVDGERKRQTYRLGIKMPADHCPFLLERKAGVWDQFITNKKALPVRRLESIEKIEPERCRCISVAASDHLYVTEDYILTHNSQLLAQLAWSACVKQGKNVFFATSETVRDTTMRRILARHSREPQFGYPQGLNSKSIALGRLTREEKEVFHAVVQDFTTNSSYALCHIAQLPRGATWTFIEHRVGRVNRQVPVDLLCIDYLQLLKSAQRYQGEREMYNEILRDAKVTAPAFDHGRGLAIVSPWQIRQADYKTALTTNGYTLASLADTSEAEKTPDLIISLLRPSPTATEGSVQVLKGRDGPTMAPSPVYLDYRSSYIGDVPSIGPSANSLEIEGGSIFALDGVLS